MRDHIRRIVAVMMVLVMVIGLVSCGGSKKETEKAEETADADTFQGELVDAQSDRIVVKGADETMLFHTSDETEYDFTDESSLTVGDELKVGYYKDNGMFYAKSVMIVEHDEEKLVFGGEVTELGETFVTVQSESMTVVFNRDDDTKIIGDLTEGDSVTVTYDGNLSENPYALGIVVIQENKEKEKKTIRGTVSEVGEKSLVISVDSAHAARFTINKETKIDGDDTKVKVGDKVKLEYTGDVMKKPVAVSIKIKRDKDKKYFIMDGVIAGASENKIIVQTSKKKYTFGIVDETRIENKKYMKSGHKTTITYMGKLGKNPVAASIFCSKDTVTAQEKKTASKKTAKKATKKATKKAAKKETKKKESKKEEKKKDDKEDKKKEDDKEKEVIIEAKGTLVEWDDPCTIKVDGGATVILDIKDADVAAGYIPEVGDQVLIHYNKDTMKLIDIQLEYRNTTPGLDAVEDGKAPVDVDELIEAEKAAAADSTPAPEEGEEEEPAA